MRNFVLFADTTSASTAFFPDHFLPMLLAAVIIFALAMLLYYVAWRVIDFLTPGDLSKELVPGTTGTPNQALAIVVGCMFLGVSLVLAAVILGVLVH